MTWTPQAAQFVGSFAPPKNPEQSGDHVENPAHGPNPNTFPMPGKTSVMQPVRVASTASKVAKVAEVAAAL